MSEFKHSIVLFSGDDGLPLEFNVRNTNEKSHLKALIEHGGGFCTQNEISVHLRSPGTKVLNVDLGKKLVSSSYIYDCVKQNYLLDVNDYVFTISEAQMSDISDEDSERLIAQRRTTCKSPSKNVPSRNMKISPIKQSNARNEDFLGDSVPFEKELPESTEKNNIVMDIDDISQPENQLLPSLSPVKRTDRCFESPNLISDKTKIAQIVLAIDTVVSSSQPQDELDNFDNILLSKALHKQPSQDEESSSETCTVSSSADAQVTSKPCSAEDHMPPLQGTNADNLPDSPNISLTEINEEDYIKVLEVEVQQILKKPPPRNIQDKTMLVKYICCVRKLTPRVVLESLLSKSSSLEL